MKNSPVIVGIAQAGVAKRPRELITYALGSCVSICLFDRKNYIAGMAHILLPHQEDAIDRQNPYKFADRGCEELLRAMTACGAGREYITAKLAGGARMFTTSNTSEGIGAVTSLQSGRSLKLWASGLSRRIRERILQEPSACPAPYTRNVLKGYPP